ncbi:MAG: hypothetical protein JWL72_2775 [Ilumatobacteraceae bacterium]|nr:hypothetical protein [Ilumatobacteraceae bacterium]MCU1389437.1 hypothetical protein [Ilumatobacteraceae bacterium]
MVHTDPMSTSWAFVRQTIFATADPAADSAALRTAYGLPAGFTDPMLLEHGIADETIPVGTDQYLELLSPSSDASPLNHWLGKRGGPGGYGVAVQVPEMAPIRERAVERGVKILIEELAFGHPIMQLNPRQCGTLLDLDEMPDRAKWFWDDITPGPSASALIDGVVEIEIGVAEPSATAALWAYLLDVEQSTATSVDLGTRVTFVPPTSGGIQAVTLRSVGERPPDTARLGATFRHVN